MIKKSHRRSKIKIVIIAAALLIAVGGSAYMLIRHNRSKIVPTTASGAKLAPATKEEKLDSSNNKDRIVQDQQNSQTKPDGKKSVTVIITSASSNTVNAYVIGVFEDGGTCTAKFTQGSTVVARTSTGFSNASYTQCAPITPNLPNNNQWSMVVSYSSPTASGNSQTQTF